MTDRSTVLAVFAHPDDEALCAAGTLALCAQRGERVKLVCATRGEYGPIASESLATPETLAEVRERELHASCAALGIDEPEFLDLPDGGVAWAAEEHDSLARLVLRIRQLRPRALITFGADGLYGHSDHAAIGELVIEARALAADPSFVLVDAPELEAFRAPRAFTAVWTQEFVRSLMQVHADAGRTAQLWSLVPEQFGLHADAITASVDVREVLSQKLRALHSHRTQLREDHALALLSGELAERFLGVEHFRCVDGLGGGPLSDPGSTATGAS